MRPSDQHGHHFSAANFAKLRGEICEIPRRYYPQIPYIPRPVGIVELTDNISKYKEFIVTCNMKTHYIRPIILIIIIKINLQRLYFIAL